MKNLNIFYLSTANLLSSLGTGLTIFLIPWLLITGENGEQIYTYISIGTTLLIFLFTPSLGSIIDTYARKQITILCEFIGMLLISITLISTIIQGEINFIFLILILVVQALYDNTKYSAISGWTQNIFHQNEYNKVNSILEVQGQAALMLSAGLTALIVGKIDIEYILFFNIITYLLAMFFYAKLPKDHKLNNNKVTNHEKNPIKSTYKDFMYSLQFIKSNKLLILFLFITTIPGIIVLVGNYLNPIFIYTFLNEAPSVQGASSVIFAIGAMFGGILPLYLLKKKDHYTAIKITNVLFLFSFILIALFPLTGIFLASRILAGLSNSATRVLRKDVLFTTIPNHLIGRINTTLNSIGLITRLILISTFGFIIAQDNIIYGYYLICILLIISTVSMLFFKEEKMKFYTLELQADIKIHN